MGASKKLILELRTTCFRTPPARILMHRKADVIERFQDPPKYEASGTGGFDPPSLKALSEAARHWTAKCHQEDLRASAPWLLSDILAQKIPFGYKPLGEILTPRFMAKRT